MSSHHHQNRYEDSADAGAETEQEFFNVPDQRILDLLTTVSSDRE